MDQIGKIKQKPNEHTTTRTAGNRLVDLKTLSKEKIHALKWDFMKIASARIGKQYVLNSSNTAIVNDVFTYFLGNEGKYDTSKGLMLCGGFGTGKTTLMQTMLNFINTLFPFNANGFKVSSVEEIISYPDNLMDSCYLYNLTKNTHGLMIKKPVSLLLNEFGHKYDIKNYGSDVNDIVRSFLMKRYDIFQDYKKVTHITTNQRKEEIINSNPPVIVDRFFEMFNIEELEGNSFRK